MRPTISWVLRARSAPRRARRREQGATAVEYALMVIMVALVILASVAIIGSKVTDMFQAAVDGF